MPLNPTGLASQLDGIASSPPASVAEAASSWSSAIGAYCSGIVPPSTTVSTAQATLQGALSSAFSGSNAAPAMEAAFSAFVATVAAGMLPAFAGVPPVAPVGFASFFSTTRSSNSAAAQELASLIDTWFRTGTAAPLPLGTPIAPWS